MENLILTNLSVDDLAIRIAEKVSIIRENYSRKDEKPELEEFLTIEQACEIIKLAKPTIYTLTCRKEIPFYKKGKKVYFKKSELSEWMATGRKKQRKEIEEEGSSFMLRTRKNES